MGLYMTKQRRLLYEYFSSNPDRQFTAARIAEDLADKGISLSAVYRNLSAFEKEGIIRKTVSSNSNEISYRYVQAEECKDSIHLTCVSCGKIIHMNEEAAKVLLRSVQNEDGFTIDKTNAVLNGICKSCDENSKKRN